MTSMIPAVLAALALIPFYGWAFRRLPAEFWQVLAVIPWRKDADGRWQGVNVTFYGALIGLAMAAGTAMAIFLAGAAGRPLYHPALSLVLLLGVSVPAASVVNRLVEGHWHGFTVGGAAFAGMAFGPWLLGLVNHWMFPGNALIETWIMVGLLAPAYALGEGMGRLACISFGCCYGRRLDACPPWLQRLFASRYFIFKGPLKKAAVESGCEGVPLLPVQALTAVLSTTAGLVGMTLFLSGRFAAAFAVPIMTTQLWRFISEFLRADYRGGGRLSAYQWMALAATGGAAVAALFAPGGAMPTPSVLAGARLLWTPGAVVLIQGIGLLGLVRMGISTVTAARVELVGRE